MMANELKPCPFCGNVATLHSERDGFWYVACSGCINQTTHFYRGKATVIKRWNTRVDERKAAVDEFLAAVHSLASEMKSSDRLRNALDEAYAEMFGAADEREFLGLEDMEREYARMESVIASASKGQQSLRPRGSNGEYSQFQHECYAKYQSQIEKAQTRMRELKALAQETR